MAGAIERKMPVRTSNLIDIVPRPVSHWAWEQLRRKKDELDEDKYSDTIIEMIVVHDLLPVDSPTNVRQLVWAEFGDDPGPKEIDKSDPSEEKVSVDRTVYDSIHRKSRELGHPVMEGWQPDGMKIQDRMDSVVELVVRTHDMLPDDLRTAVAVKEWKNSI